MLCYWCFTFVGFFFFSSRRRHTRCALVTGVQTCALPICQFQAGFDASWELDLFGGNGRQVEAAGYDMEAAEQELRATLLTLVGDVDSSYVQARGLHARIAYARQNAPSPRRTEALTHVTFAPAAAGEAAGAHPAPDPRGAGPGRS